MEFADGRKEHQKNTASKLSNATYVTVCGWGYSNKSAPKLAEHKEDCPAIWIFEEWKPQPLEKLKFVKS